MPLNDTFPKAIVFIVGEYEKDGVIHKGVVGTGFLVLFPSSVAGKGYIYVCTSAHVVRPLIRSWIQLNKKAGGVEPVPVHTWFYHPSNDIADDVAVSPMRGSADYDYRLLPMNLFIDAYGGARLGNRVYFIGLLGQMKNMVAKNIPMVRGGTVGALNQEGVPIEIAPGTTINVKAHLMDCRSFGGFSGSPCFVQADGISLTGEGGEAAIGWASSTFLLGLLIAHFDVNKPATLTGELASISGKVEMPINTGVGVVLPIERLRELLMEEKQLAGERKKMDEQLVSQEKQSAATPDLATDY